MRADGTLNVVEHCLLDLLRSDPEREWESGALRQALGVHPDAYMRARNALWRAGYASVGCRGRVKLKREDD